MEKGINDLLGGFDISVHYDFLKDRYMKNYPNSSEIEMVRREIEVHERDLDSFKEFFQYGEGVAFLDYDEATNKIKSVFIASLEDLRKREKYLAFFKDKLNFLELKQKLAKNEKSGKSKIASLPRQIALLEHIGFFELEYFKSLSQSKVDKITALLLNTQERSVRGNRSSLKDENIGHNKYTSYKHINDIIKDLDNL